MSFPGGFESADLKIFALSEIALGRAEAGDAKGALAAAQKIEDARRKAQALVDIASTLAERGDVKQAVEVTQKIEDATSKAGALRQIVLTVANAGEIQQALKVAHQVDGDARFSTLIAIAPALTEAAEFKQVVEAAEELEGSRRKAHALRRIALALATEPIPDKKVDTPDRRITRRMKRVFSPTEKQLAKRIVEACIQGR